MTTQNSISIDDLVIGAVADESLYDQRGMLLVPSGLVITDALIATLRGRGATALSAAKPSVSSMDPPSSSCKATDAEASRKSESARVYSDEQVQRIRGRFQASTGVVESLARSAEANGTVDLREAEREVENFIGELVDDPDPVVANALEYEANLKLATRCVQFSVLSMAIGLRLQLPREQVRKIGAAAIVHDWALFDLPMTARFPHQTRTDAQRKQYLQHPLVAKEMLEFADQVDPETKVMVAQVHELLDGSGYPKRIRAAQIHPLSRILCVADAYLTLTSPPKGSPRIVPCDAIAYLISGASKGQYSAKAVNGLLRAVSPYPIGSIVELSDATKARVIRCDTDDIYSPIVVSLEQRGRVIQLKDKQLFIARPIISSEQNEIRLPDVYQTLATPSGDASASNRSPVAVPP